MPHYDKKDDTQNKKCEELAAPETSKTCVRTGTGTHDSTMAIIPVRVTLMNGDTYVETYACLDEGSDATLCATKLMDDLNARGRKTKIRLRPMEQTSTVDTYVVKGLEVCDLNSTNAVKLPVLYTRKEMLVSMEDVPKQEDVDRWPYLPVLRENSARVGSSRSAQKQYGTCSRAVLFTRHMTRL